MSVASFPSKVSAWAQQLTNARAASTFLGACEADGIPALPVKGIVSATTLYDDRADRPLTDVDVRVVPTDVKRVARLCRARGWPVVQRMRSYANLVAIVDRVYVDVEGYVGAPGMCSLHVSSMLDRATWSDALGFRARLPDYLDHAVLLVVNAFKDKLSGAFEWAIRDLEQTPRRPEFDARALAARLRDGGCTTIGFVVADWMVRARGAERWSEVLRALGPAPRTRYVLALQNAIERDAAGLRARVLGRIGADSPAMRARALAHMAAWQTEVVLSKLGPAPYVRGFVSDDVRAKPRS